MDLPFKTPPKASTHAIGNARTGVLELPKYSSVTPSEELQIIPILQKTGAGNDAIVYLTCKREIAHIALQRIAPEATQEQVDALPMVLVDGLFEYLLSERRGWVTEEAEEGEKKSTGATIAPVSSAPSPATTTDSAPAGQPDTTETASAKSPSRKSAKVTEPI